MNQSLSMAKRLREVILNGTWIANTNYHQQLNNLGWQIAVQPVAHLHTIAVIAQHVHYYIKGVKEVLQGGELTIKDQFAFDFTEIKSQVQWDSFLVRFWQDAEALAALVEQLSTDQLAACFIEERYLNYQRNIEAMIEHSYYHLGQIVLINKIINHPSN